MCPRPLSGDLTIATLALIQSLTKIKPEGAYIRTSTVAEAYKQISELLPQIYRKAYPGSFTDIVRRLEKMGIVETEIRAYPRRGRWKIIKLKLRLGGLVELDEMIFDDLIKGMHLKFVDEEGKVIDYCWLRSRKPGGERL